MLISDQKAFIFVHIEKTAGTSITSALLPFAIQQPTSKWYSVLRAFGLPNDYHRYKYPMHGGLAVAQKTMPAERFDRYYKFAFVRNPWDRLVSEYNAAIHKNRRARHRKIKAMNGFDEYVDYEIHRNKLAQYPMVCNLKGNNALDFIGRFENLVDDFNAASDHLGLAVKLEKLNSFKHGSYRDYYTDASRERVRQHWAQDIEAFNYEF